jgi:hypothetical protein
MVKRLIDSGVARRRAAPVQWFPAEPARTNRRMESPSRIGTRSRSRRTTKRAMFVVRR